METLAFDFIPAASTSQPDAPRSWALAGVLASGNLEVLVEAIPAADPGGESTREPTRSCRVEIHTAAHGFGEVWSAVCDDFFQRHGPALSGLKFSVNDAGATPAVVSLRLEQALSEFRPPPPERDRGFEDWHA